MSQGSQNINQQFIDGGVIPGHLVSQEATSKTYVDGQLAQRDVNISGVAASAAAAQATANTGVSAAGAAQSTANTAVGLANTAQGSANVAQSTIDLHKASAVAHSAASITYTGPVEGAANTKQAIDLVKQRVDTIVAGAGESNTEILDARQPATGPAYPILGARLNNVDAQLADIATIYARDYGVMADDSTDDTIAMLQALSAAITKLPCTIRLPKGTIRYTDLGNIAYEGLTIEGLSEFATILKCTSTVPNHNAIYMNAFKNDLPTDQFVFKCNLKNLQVQGNSNTLNIIYAQGIVGSKWENVIANSANNTTGKSFHFRSVITTLFINVNTSNNQGVNTPIPHTGLYLTEGTRGGVGAGNSTNNTFLNCYYESVAIGTHLYLADHNTFISGAAEACSDMGVYIEQSTNRWNTFINVAFENNTNYDVYDKGRSNQFINTYSNKLIRLEGEQSKLSGGFHAKVETPGRANDVENIRVNRNGTDQGGFSDTGIGNYWKNIQDANVAVNAYIYPLKSRVSITVGSSPFAWQNTTGHYVEVIAQTGTLTQVLGRRAGGSDWVLPLTTPGIWLVAPNDSLVISYSSAPGLSYLTLNGF